MITTTRHTGSVLICGIVFALVASLPRPAAAEDDKTPAFDAAAEAAEAKKEDEEQMAERLSGIKGKYQKRFMGTLVLLTAEDKKEQPNPEVVATFITSEEDRNPGRTYLVKVEKKSPAFMALVKKYDCKHVIASGKLRNAEKYLIIHNIDETGITQPVVERRSFGGI